jgi:NADH-quinone oxidoreductase subunit H
MNFALILEWLIKGIILVFLLLGGFAYLTLYERKALARIQMRVGPNRAGPWGILQPIADAVKLIFKEELMPAKSDKVLFFLAPVITLVPALVITAVVPWGPTLHLFGRDITLYIADINVGVLYIMAVASIAVYGIVLAGWSSNNKYAMLGGLRSTAQMISYEIALGLSFVGVILLAGSAQMTEIVEAQKSAWFVLLQPVGTVIFLIATLAEVNRAPFDMPEAEQELTAGYHTEYSGMKFALLFMAEYDKMIAISSIGATLFFGGYREFWFLSNTILSVDRTPWLGPIYIFLKIFILLFGMIWVRATFPRIRYDRLMAFGWKVLLPLSLVLVFFTAVFILLADQAGNALSLWGFPLIMWGLPVISLLAGLVAVGLLYLTLRRKEYARA